MDAALQRCNIRISNYLSNTSTKGYKDVVEMIAEGITDPEELVKAIHGRTINRGGRNVVLGALTGVIMEADIDMVRQLRDEVELADKHKDECQSKMDALCRQWFPDEYALLQTIPGVKARSATAILAELGNDVSAFPDAVHLTSWCGLKPRNDEAQARSSHERSLTETST